MHSAPQQLGLPIFFILLEEKEEVLLKKINLSFGENNKKRRKKSCCVGTYFLYIRKKVGTINSQNILRRDVLLSHACLFIFGHEELETFLYLFVLSSHNKQYLAFLRNKL